jgi:hypothetical protein
MADGLLTQGLNYIDQQKQALAARLGLLMNNPQEFAAQLGSEARQRAGVGLLGQPKTAQEMASGAWINSPYGQQAMEAGSGFAGTILPSKDIANKVFYRGSTADEKLLRPSSGHEHGVTGISTTLDKEFAKTHGDYIKAYQAKAGDFIDFFDLVKMYNNKFGKDAFLDAADKDVTKFAKSKGYIGSYYNDPMGGADYRFFDASSLIPIDKVKK